MYKEPKDGTKAPPPTRRTSLEKSDKEKSETSPQVTPALNQLGVIGVLGTANEERAPFTTNDPFGEIIRQKIDPMLHAILPGYYVKSINLNLSQQTAKIECSSAWASKDFYQKHLNSGEFPDGVRKNACIYLANTEDNLQLNAFIEDVCKLDLPAQLKSKPLLTPPSNEGCFVM